MIAFNACSGPIPLRWACGALRGNGPALAEEALGSRGFRAVREGFLVFASKARCGPIPLRWAYLALRGIGPALAGDVGTGWAFALAREGE